MSNIRPRKNEINGLFFAGCLIGILCFAVIYGLKIVNPFYDGWIFHGDMDLRQHYVGFCHFRTTPWHFPIGLIDTLSVPYSMSVVYTDSIPIFALVFKLLSGILPESFQYFGFFGLLSYTLMGGLSPVLIRRFTDNKMLCMEGSLFFTLSFPLLQRMYYHTALSAQWIIILALILWVYTDITDKTQIKKLSVYWALIGILSVFIHSYFVFMTGIVLLAQVVDGYARLYIKEKNESAVNSKKIKLLTRVIKDNIQIILPLICMGISSFVILYLLGGFYGKGSVSGDGFGDFNANLSAYINPLGFSSIFKGFNLYGFFEYEGFAYVGAGIILILICALVTIILEKNGKIKNADGKNTIENNVDEWSDIKLNKAVIFAFILLVLFASCFPSFSFGRFKLIGIPVPVFVRSMLGICRTNARFVWVGMYLILVAALWFVAKRFDRKYIQVIFTIAVLLQVVEVFSVSAKYHQKYEKDYEYESIWEQLESENVIDGKEEFVFMYGDSDIMMDTGYYAYKHGMSQNSYYYARTIYDEINENIAEWTEKFLNGELSEKAVYVFRNEDYTKEFEKAAKEANAKIYKFDGHVAVIK